MRLLEEQCEDGKRSAGIDFEGGRLEKVVSFISTSVTRGGRVVM